MPFRADVARAVLAVMLLTAAAPPALAQLTRINPEGMRKSPFYSHAVVAPSGGRTVYIAGQVGFDAKGAIDPDFRRQMKQAFANLRTVMAASGVRPEHVARITVLIVDHDEAKLKPLGEELIALFGDKLPASTLHPVPRLAAHGLLFEIDAIAVVPD